MHMAEFRPKAHTLDVIVQAVREFYEGVSQSDLAKKYHVRRRTIYTWIKTIEEKGEQLGVDLDAFSIRAKTAAMEFWGKYKGRDITRSELWRHDRSLAERLKKYGLLGRLVPKVYERRNQSRFSNGLQVS